jgi:histidinol phosphatase-like PHP family hydrolase
MGADSLINLHTHTRFSDGDHTPELIVATAERKHLTHIAITDHFETSKVHSLLAADLDEYMGIIDEARKRHPGIRVLTGVEIDTRPGYCNLAALPVDRLNQLDLVLFEHVQTKEGSSIEDLDPLLRQLEIPCGLAHNDIVTNFDGQDPDEVAELFASYALFVEVNTAWPYKRDGMPFYEHAAEYYAAFHNQVQVSVGTDVHHEISEVYNLEQPYRFLRRLGLLGDLLC